MKSKQQAEDITQDTFVRLMTKKVAIVPEQPRALLLTIAQGMMHNFYRHQKIEARYLAFIASLPQEYQPDPQTQAMLYQAVLELEQRLDGLKPLHRQAFLLTQLEGLSQADTAAQLGVSIATVQRYVAKALHQCCFSSDF